MPHVQPISFSILSPAQYWVSSTSQYSDYCTILIISVASPLSVTTEFWRYSHSDLLRISAISITLYQTNVALDARRSHLNKRTVILCSLDFTDLVKGTTNATLLFERGYKTLYTEWVKNQNTSFSTFSDRVRGKYVSFFTLKQKITKFNVLYSLTNIVRVIKSRRMGWDGHVACMGEEKGGV